MIIELDIVKHSRHFYLPPFVPFISILRHFRDLGYSLRSRAFRAPLFDPVGVPFKSRSRERGGTKSTDQQSTA